MKKKILKLGFCVFDYINKYFFKIQTIASISGLIGIIGFVIYFCYFNEWFVANEHKELKKYENLFVDKNDKKISCERSSDSLTKIFLAKQQDTFDEIYQTRKSDYNVNITMLNNTLKLLILFIVIGLYILFYNPEVIEVPFLGLKIPQTLVYGFVIFGLVFEWLQLGMTFNACIDSRYALNALSSIHETFGEYHLSNKLSSKQTFVDNGMVDSWFAFFYPNDFKLTSGKSLFYTANFLTLFLLIGTFHSLIHTVCIILALKIVEIKKKYKILAILPSVSFVFFALSSVCFCYKFTYSLPFLSYMWLMIGVFFFIWKIYETRIIENFTKPQNKYEHI